MAASHISFALLLISFLSSSTAFPAPSLPIVVNTWGGPFTAAADAAYLALLKCLESRASDTTSSGVCALDAVQVGLETCERDRCDGTVGPGGSPDEACETTLDALLIDGKTLNAGAVAGLRRVRSAAAVARAVLDHTAHTMLVGDQATAFAVENGFVEEDLGSEESRALCTAWKESGCRGNYRRNVLPDPGASCGPYKPVNPRDMSLDGGCGGGSGSGSDMATLTAEDVVASHDTISMIAIDRKGAMAAGTSTNGAAHKIPGRVGDGPIVGSGSYVDGDVGGCGATGDGDVMMRFLPCYQAVENLRRGMSPQAAAEDAVRRMVRKYPAVLSGIVVVNNKGVHGGAASGWTFTYSFRGGEMNTTGVVTVLPLNTGEYELFYLEPNLAV